MLRGLYYSYQENSAFIPCLNITKLILRLEKSLMLTLEKQDSLCNELYTLTANYNVETEICWLKLEDAENQINLSWGKSPITEIPKLSDEALIAAYYIWKTANCTPEEASKVLKISIEDLMALSNQFENIN